MYAGVMSISTVLARPYEIFDTTIVRRERLTPQLVRLTFGGEALNQLADRGYDQRIKLIMPQPGGDPLGEFPRGDDWFTLWRGMPQSRRPAIRTYTVGAVRPGEIDVDMVDHGTAGPGSRLATTGRLGQEVGIVGPHAAYEGDHGGLEFRRDLAGSARQLIVGDESALPAIAGIVRELPQSATGLVCIETSSDRGRLDLPAPHGVDVRWCTAENGRGVDQRAIVHAWMSQHHVDAVSDARTTVYFDGTDDAYWEVSDPASRARTTELSAWVAGESSVVKDLRRMLVGEFDVPKAAVAFMGYWRVGCAGA